MTMRILLVDDDALIRAGLRAILDAEPDLTVVGEAADGAEVPAAVARVNPHVVVMDVRMPAIDGIQATRQLLTLASPPVVLVLTTFENDDYV
jgi:DNA-binding NarL/FixJ family response regulator